MSSIQMVRVAILKSFVVKVKKSRAKLKSIVTANLTWFDAHFHSEHAEHRF